MEQITTKTEEQKENPQKTEPETNVNEVEKINDNKPNITKRNQNKQTSKSTKTGEGQTTRSQPPRKITKILGFISDGKEPKVVVSYNDSHNPELITTSYAHSHCSKLLVKYYESKIKFQFPNENNSNPSPLNSNAKTIEANTKGNVVEKPAEQPNTLKNLVSIPNLIHEFQQRQQLTGTVNEQASQKPVLTATTRKFQ